MKKFSIITICLNEPKLEHTCESIVNQTFQDFEWIVIDGGSNAETLVVFEKYKSRMDYFVSEKDHGIYDAMNKGIAKASGQWINFMNAGDCFIDSHILSVVYKKLTDESNIDVLYGDYIANDSDIIVKAPDAKKEDMYFKILCQQTSFIRRSIFKKFTYNTKFKICSDWDFWYKLLLANCRFRRMDTVIARFYENGVSHTNPKALFEELTTIRAQYYTPKEITVFKKKQALLLRKRMYNV